MTAVEFEEPRHFPRNCHGERPVSARVWQHRAVCGEIHVAVCLSGGHLAEVEGVSLAVVPSDHRKAAATDSGGKGLHDAEHQGGGHRGIDRIATFPQHRGADLRREGVVGRHHAAKAAGFIGREGSRGESLQRRAGIDRRTISLRRFACVWGLSLFGRSLACRIGQDRSQVREDGDRERREKPGSERRRRPATMSQDGLLVGHGWCHHPASAAAMELAAVHLVFLRLLVARFFSL